MGEKRLAHEVILDALQEEVVGVGLAEKFYTILRERVMSEHFAKIDLLIVILKQMTFSDKHREEIIGRLRQIQNQDQSQNKVAAAAVRELVRHLSEEEKSDKK